MIAYRIECKRTKLGVYKRDNDGYIDPFRYHIVPTFISKVNWRFGWNSNKKFFDMFLKEFCDDLKEGEFYFVAYDVKEYEEFEDGQIYFNLDKAKRVSKYIVPHESINEITLFKKYRGV